MAAFFKPFEVRVSAVYLIVAILWIILSDTLVARLSDGNPAVFIPASTWKGVGFVAVTTLALFVIIAREIHKRAKIEQSLLDDIQERKQAEEAEREQGRFAEALRESLFALTASLDVDQVMQQILDSAAAVVPCEAGSIVLFENHEGRIAYTRGFPPESLAFIANYRFPNQYAQSASAFGASKPYLVTDTKSDPNWIALPFTAWIRSTIGIPIEIREKVIGVLISDSAEPHHFQQSDVEKLTAFARYAALALENAYHVTRLEQNVLERTAELQSAKIRVEAILNNSLDGILLAYTDLHIQQTNAAFNTLLACDYDDYFDASLLDLIHQDEVDYISETLEKVLSERAGKQVETCVRRKDGTTFDAELSIGYVRDMNNETDSLVCAIRDITERKQAEQALNARLDEEREFQQHLKTLHEITIDLTLIDQLDEFYRRAVELGLSRLGFERMGLFLYNAEDESASGTYGTDSEGNLVHEHQIRLTPAPTGLMMRAFRGVERFAFDDNVPLHRGHREIVGTGWNATAVLRNGAQGLGWLVADNLISQKPATKSLLDILALYGLTLGTLLARKQTDAALRDSESRLRESQQMLQNILETIPVRVFWKDLNSVYLGCNRLFAQDAGVASSKEVIGKGDDAMPWRERAEDYIATDKALITSGLALVEYEQAVASSDGTLHWYQNSKMPLRDITGEPIGILGMYIDITERKHSEEALRQAFEREKELGELKSRFVSMASHELRTPLTSILSSAEILTRYRAKMDDEQIQEKLDLIARQVKHLGHIIEDVLDLGRMQSGHGDFSPSMTDLDLLCQDIVAEFQGQSVTTHEVLYHCGQKPVMLYLDHKLIRQVVTNLISNAIKYSPASQRVWIVLELRDQSAVLCVRDTGIGIPAADIKHLFEPFHRARNVGAISGTGLGLAISKEAVERHDGTISVESEVGVGTTFCVHLPRD